MTRGLRRRSGTASKFASGAFLVEDPENVRPEHAALDGVGVAVRVHVAVVVAVVACPAERRVLERERAEEKEDGLGRGVALVRAVREAAVVARADPDPDRHEEREGEDGLPPHDSLRRRVPRGAAEADDGGEGEEEDVHPVARRLSA